MNKKEKALAIFKAFRKGTIEYDLNTDTKHVIEYELISDDDVVVKNFFSDITSNMQPKAEIIIIQMILKPNDEQVKILDSFLQNHHNSYIVIIEPIVYRFKSFDVELFFAPSISKGLKVEPKK